MHVVVVTASEQDAILAGTKTMYSFTGRPGFKGGEAVRFTDGVRNAQVKVATVNVSGRDVADIKEHTTADFTEKDAQAQGYADLAAFAAAWDAEKRNREASKQFVKNPVVHTVKFGQVEALPDTVTEAPEPKPAKKKAASKGKGPLARKKSSRKK